MQGFLFGTYQFISVLLYLFLSTLLIYHRLFRRWIRFSLAFFLVYLVGSFSFFGRLPLPFEDFLISVPYILLYFASPVAFGIFIYRGMTAKEIVGAYIIFVFSFAP